MLFLWFLYSPSVLYPKPTLNSKPCTHSGHCKMKPFLIPDSNPFYRSLFKGTIFVLYRPLHYLPHLGSEELAECGPTTAPVSGFLKGLDRVLVGLGFGVWEFSVSACRGSGFRGLGCCPDSVVATAAAAAALLSALRCHACRQHFRFLKLMLLV